MQINIIRGTWSHRETNRRCRITRFFEQRETNTGFRDFHAQRFKRLLGDGCLRRICLAGASGCLCRPGKVNRVRRSPLDAIPAGEDEVRNGQRLDSVRGFRRARIALAHYLCPGPGVYDPAISRHARISEPGGSRELAPLSKCSITRWSGFAIRDSSR